MLRAGFGIFYDRFALGSTLTSRRDNGVVQQQYVVTDPDFYPTVPSIASLAGSESRQVIEEINARMRAPYIMQSAFTVERQLPHGTTLALTYTNSHGLHQFRSEDVNAPLPGTYNPSVPGSGVFPRGNANPVFLMESTGLYNQNQFIANVNSKLNSSVSLFGSYVLNYARSNSDGFGSIPANPYSLAGEYGPASTDVRNRMSLGGSINTRWNLRFSPLVSLQSGAPFDITSGADPYGTTLFNARPGIATGPSRPGLIPTQYGLLDPNPAPGERILSRNAGRGPGQFSVNLRVAKTIGFGPETGKQTAAAPPPSQGGPGGNLGGAGLGGGPRPGGGGFGGLFSPPSSSRRYSVTLSVSARNILNHTNSGPIVGNMTSPLFGFANQMAGAVNGEGFSENANNRRLELQVRFAF